MIGFRIKKAREKMGLTAHALAKKTGVKHQTLYRIEKGKGARLETLKKLTNFLKIKL